MGYQTIATVLNADSDQNAAFEAAIAFAKEWDADLEIYGLTLTYLDSPHYYMGASAVMIAEQAGDGKERAAAQKAEISARLKSENLRWHLHQATLPHSAIQNYLGRNLRFCDLVLLPRPYQGSDNVAALVEAALFDAERPVLMIPRGAATTVKMDRIALGWNGGAEALSAIRAASPLCRQASHVDICKVVANDADGDTPDPLLTYLRRHKIAADLSLLPMSDQGAGQTLLMHAHDSGADLLVAGAYGHSRLREAVFGGATRKLLESADIPMFMSR
ncbi:universal stress protein [Yoonia sp. SS1-5]|uniref:Universal stress protein n=1 Tax=Yoonia rhodophyticola TaxID=3137370 RepID=A0AAN0NKM9_9RHOB